MEKLKIIIIRLTLLICVLFISVNCSTFATSNQDLFKIEEYSEEFKEWLKLSDEEKNNVIMPRMYTIENTYTTSKNPLKIARMLRASINSRYSLKDVIPANLIIKNQQETNSCWAFSALSSLETNLALYNYKNNINPSKIYDYSERHMEYATSQSFNNNEKNKMGYNRKVGSGGNYYLSEPYLTNGNGAIPESEMPFENNEDVIDIENIQNKTISSQVYDTIEFADYNKNQTDENKTEIMNQIKQHIQDYGSVQASIHGGDEGNFSIKCYNEETYAKFCDGAFSHRADHAVSIIGWDDNFSKDKFVKDLQPKAKGAWIVRNSWGDKIEYNLSDLKEKIFENNESACISRGWKEASEIPNEIIEEMGYKIENNIAYISYGDNGLIYVSYEDVNISTSMFGIVKASDTVDYDYIYQYDDFYSAIQISFSKSNMMICNIFDKKTTGTEYLTQVSLYSPDTYDCKVYVNSNGTGKSKSELQLVQLKEGESETVGVGYHTLEFLKPVELKANSYAVVIEIQSDNNTVKLPIESKIDSVSMFDSVIVENEKCFLALGNDLTNCQWIDLSKLSEEQEGLSNGDSTIKAFTKTQLFNDSLEKIEITTPPNKISYFEGENFDKTGMVVTAYYNSETNSSVVLDSSNYSITNGTNMYAGQTSVTIKYKDKSINQPISVMKNSVEKLQITTPPNKTSYFEGEMFDKTGMVVEATFMDETTKTITDYTIENGNNLKSNQTRVTISYGEKTVEQEIIVTPNLLIEIKVTKAPDKTKYVVGQSFDKTGMIVTGSYQNKTTQEIVDYIIVDGTNLTIEQSSITIKYGEKTTTQSITVEKKSITGISINKMPSKIKYIQNKEVLDLTDGTLKINYNDNSNEDIKLTSDLIKISGFDNTKVGKNTVTIYYQTKSTTMDVEIVAEVVAHNSNFDKANCRINSAKYYTFSNNNTEEYIVLDITIKDINKNEQNDSMEYYYYLSSNQAETNIQDWIKIKVTEIASNKLIFEINTKDIKNYSELSDSETLYLYIKEVAVKGGNQSVLLSKSMKLEISEDIETYIDGVKKEIIPSENSNTNDKVENSNTNNKVDNTIASVIIPQTGKSIIILFIVVSVVGIVIYVFIRYKNLKKYV